MLGWEILSHLFFLQKLLKKVDLAVSLIFFLSRGDRVFLNREEAIAFFVLKFFVYIKWLQKSSFLKKILPFR
jgi:hypothetical protein